MDSALVSQFVNVVNSAGLDPLFERDVPEELRILELTEIPGMFRWEIRAAEANAWVSEVESSLPYPFPRLYRLLIEQFRFAEFVAGPVMFLANTGTEVFNELSRVFSVGDVFHAQLLQHGFLQFGRQAGGGFDPVCFAMKQRKNGDAPVVQLDHEEVIIRNRIHVQKEIAPSFRAFVERAIAGEFSMKRNT
jgi:hypothetical protein